MDYNVQRLAKAHHNCLPSSLLSLLGLPVLCRFYRFVAESKEEELFILGDDVIGVAILSKKHINFNNCLLWIGILDNNAGRLQKTFQVPYRYPTPNFRRFQISNYLKLLWANFHFLIENIRNRNPVINKFRVKYHYPNYCRSYKKKAGIPLSPLKHKATSCLVFQPILNSLHMY